jgi:membrane-associated protease RseP (regulator of RpoE activity)
VQPVPTPSDDSTFPGLRRPRVRRPWLNVVLLGLTTLSLSVAGGLVAEPPDIEPSELATPWGWLRVIVAGVPYAFWVLLIVGSHEMGHFVACRRHGVPVSLPYFLPGVPPIGTFGAILRIRGALPHRRALFDIGAAGPFAGIAVAVPVLVAGLVTAEPSTAPPDAAGLVLGAPLGWKLLVAPVWPHDAPPVPNALIVAGWVGVLITSLNLFAAGQLDGGHVAYAVSRRLHRVLSFGTIAGLFVLVLWQVVVEREAPAYLVWLAALAWMRDRHPPVVDDRTPLGRWRTALALLLAAIGIACFIPVPLRFVGP